MGSLVSNPGSVKLGVCTMYYDKVDLGYTIGGATVEMTTNTTKVEVDQFGDTPINEVIRGRMVTVKANLAETSLEKMQRVIPGAVLTETGAAAATGTITIATNLEADETVVVNGVTLTAKASGAVGEAQFNVGASAALTAASLADCLNASHNPALGLATYTASSEVITVAYKAKGVEGNDFTLAVGTAGVSLTLSGATLAGGTAATSSRLEVKASVGLSLLDNAKELRLHPIANAESDMSEDVFIPLASTPGNISFAYKLDEERVFAVEFTSYPDRNNDFKILQIGG